MSETAGFIERHGLWSESQQRQARDIVRRLETDDIKLVRIAWADPHGASRAKALSVPAFKEALVNGYNINVATSTLDASGGRVFTSFVRGGGMDLDEMTGSPNLTIVPDPETFRVLPWAPGVAWILTAEYFRDGRPFHFSTRHLLKREIARLADRGLNFKVGLEVEWYLAHLIQNVPTAENTGVPGRRGKPYETAPVEPGYAYHSETNLDVMQPILSLLAETYETLGLKLRSVENEYGPGQVECTFGADDALRAADDYVLFRTATRQVSRRNALVATFMCRPRLENHFSSGWHLHQSLTDAENEKNVFVPTGDTALSDMGLQWLGGLMEHAVSGSAFATPTVNGYRRFLPNSLAPDRVTWGIDHRGTLMRVISGPGDPASRIENRAPEPAANPYLLFAAQIAAGLDGLDKGTDPGPAETNPYEADAPMLPPGLPQALEALAENAMYRAAFGDLFVDYFLQLKAAELGRYQAFCDETGIDPAGDEITEWEQNEYYDFF